MGIRVDAETRRKLLALAGEPAGPEPPRRARAAKRLVAPVGTVEILVPLKTSNPLNRREHWTARPRRGKSARQAWAAALAVTVPAFRVVPPFRVTLTRLGGNRLDPGDGLPASLKQLVDVVCETLGVDDGDVARVTFRYEQRPGGPWGVVVRIASGGLE